MRDWLAHRTNATPTATALARAGLDYRDLDERCESLSGRLAARGVGVDDALAVVLETRVEFVEVVHVAQRLGAVLVPIDARMADSRIESRLGRIDPAAVVCSEDTERVAVESIDAPALSVDATDVAEPLSTVTPQPFDLPEWKKDDPMVVMFTSGTTGEPKGVVLTLGNVLASATASAFRLGLRPDDCWHVPLPMYHMGGLAPIYRSVVYGTALSVQEGFDPETTLSVLREADATCVSLVPTMLRRLLEAGPGPLSDLRFVLLGGAACPPELLERAQKRDVSVAPTYGMTETASGLATARPEEALEHPGTVGNPLMFATASVRDEQGAPCETNEVGELVVSGPMVTAGYLDETATAESFHNGGFRTGDLGYRDDEGRLWVTGRADERIVSGGETIDPGEIADALRSHPSVTDAAIVGLPDAEWGERVAALVVPPDGADPPDDDLIAHCRERLADYKLPRTVEFTDDLPRTASGTVDRQAVREALSETEG